MLLYPSRLLPLEVKYVFQPLISKMILCQRNNSVKQIIEWMIFV